MAQNSDPQSNYYPDNNQNPGQNPNPNYNNQANDPYGANAQLYPQYDPATTYSAPQGQYNQDPNVYANPSSDYTSNDYGDYQPVNTQNPAGYSDYSNTYDPNYQDPNSTYPDQNYANPSSDYSQDYGQAGANYDYNDPNQAYASQAEIPAQNPPETNTFEEKKSGNRLIMIIAGVVVVALLVATVALFIFNQNNNNPNTNTTSSSSSQISESSVSSSEAVSSQAASFNTSLTGGPESPASKARVNNSVVLPAEWVNQSFRSPSIDNQGKCINTNVCGEQADPDLDGLLNVDEYNFATDPQSNDHDRDGISDGNEVYVYFSNPKNNDTDGDGQYQDGSEIANCFDPNSTGSQKMDAARLAQITSSASFRPLTDPTKQTLKGATQDDLNKGYVAKTCTPTTATPGASSSRSSVAATSSTPASSISSSSVANQT